MCLFINHVDMHFDGYPSMGWAIFKWLSTIQEWTINNEGSTNLPAMHEVLISKPAHDLNSLEQQKWYSWNILGRHRVSPILAHWVLLLMLLHGVLQQRNCNQRYAGFISPSTNASSLHPHSSYLLVNDETEFSGNQWSPHAQVHQVPKFCQLG